MPKGHDSLIQLLRQCFQHNPDDRPNDMREIASRLKEIYQATTGNEYSRKEPKAAELLADALNNKAVSMLDLGNKEEAERLYEEALKADPHHTEATYNRGLILWRSGRITDMDLVKQMEEVRTTHQDDWRDEYLLGLVHIERGDAESAVKVLKEASEQAPNAKDVQIALEAAQIGRGKYGYCIQTFIGETRKVFSAVSIPHSRYILSGGNDNMLRLWDVPTGRCIHTLDGHDGPVSSLAVSNCGRWVLSGSTDGTTRLWDMNVLKCSKVLECKNSVWTVAISTDGCKGVITRFESRGPVLLDLTIGKKCLEPIFSGHKNEVLTATLSPDDHWVLTGSWDNTLRLWELASGKCVRVFEGHTNFISSAVFSSDSQYILSGSLDNTMRIWDTKTGQCVKLLVGHKRNVCSVALSRDGYWALSGSMDNTIRLWNLTNGQCVRTIESHKERVTSVSFSADSKYILSASEDGSVKLWDINSLDQSIQHRQTAPVLSSIKNYKQTKEERNAFVAILKQVDTFSDTGDYNKVFAALRRACDLPSYKRNKELLDRWNSAGLNSIRSRFRAAWRRKVLMGHKDEICFIAISSDSHWALSCSKGKKFKLWGLAKSQSVCTFECSKPDANPIPFVTGIQLALSHYNDTIKLCELANGKCLYRPYTSRENIILSADGYRIIIKGYKNLKIWDLVKGQCIQTLQIEDLINSIALTPNERMALLGTDNTIRLWDLTTRKCIRSLDGHTNRVVSIVVTPNGKFAISGSWDNTVRLWDIDMGNCIMILNDHDDSISSVAISYDGQWVLSGSWDTTLRLWDIKTGKCVWTFESSPEFTTYVALSPDGRWVMSGKKNGNIELWELLWDYDFPGWTDWDDGAKLYLETFLTLHCPYGDDGINRVGKPNWNEDDYQKLIRQLQYAGFGWLRPEGIRKKLEEMTANWQGPPPLPSADE